MEIFHDIYTDEHGQPISQDLVIKVNGRNVCFITDFPIIK